MFEPKRFPFMRRKDRYGVSNHVPYLPLNLMYGESALEVYGLLDTGASVNILPYDLGVELGAVWESQTTEIRLGGDFAAIEARGLVMSAQVGKFPLVRLAFAWVRSSQIPLILGRSNFFAEFNVCFFTSESEFEICPK